MNSDIGIKCHPPQEYAQNKGVLKDPPIVLKNLKIMGKNTEGANLGLAALHGLKVLIFVSHECIPSLTIQNMF